MDITSIAGIIIAFAFVIYGILSGGELMTFVDLPSVYIVIGGTIGSIVITSSIADLKNFRKVIGIAFSNRVFDPSITIKQIIDLSYIARKEGLLSLENKAEELEDLFFKKGILLAVDGMSGELIRDVMNAEIDSMLQRHKKGRNIFDVGAMIAPAFGMIGTLIGLINMLVMMSTPEKIGPQMSIALITTLYGSLLSNVVFLPLSRKLKVKTDDEVFIRELIIEGIISIQAGENTRFLEQKLLSFLSPNQRLDKKGDSNEQK